MYCFSGIPVKMYVGSQEGLHTGMHKQINKKILNREQVNHGGRDGGGARAGDSKAETSGLDETLKWRHWGYVRTHSLECGGSPKRGPQGKILFLLLGFAF